MRMYISFKASIYYRKECDFEYCKTKILFLDVYVDGVFLLHTLKDVSWASGNRRVNTL